MPHPEFVSIGHVSYDAHVSSEGGRSSPAPGGAAAFTALTARSLGLSAGVVTACGDDYIAAGWLRGVSASVVPGGATTTFEDRYTDGVRTQRLLSSAGKIAPGDVPSGWRQPGILVVCPLLDELPLDCLRWFGADFSCLIPQGWFRTVGPAGAINIARPPVETIAGPWDLIVVSSDEARTEPEIAEWRSVCDVLAVTRAERGAVLYRGGEALDVPAVGATPVDPTGAGDVWAAAFAISYSRSRDPRAAGAFAAAAAAVCVERPGLEGVPARAEIEARL